MGFDLAIFEHLQFYIYVQARIFKTSWNQRSKEVPVNINVQVFPHNLKKSHTCVDTAIPSPLSDAFMELVIYEIVSIKKIYIGILLSMMTSFSVYEVAVEVSTSSWPFKGHRA